VSCPSAGNCATAGNTGPSDNDWLDAPFVFSERHGDWGKVKALTGPANNQMVSSFAALSCPSAGNCGAGGSYITALDGDGNPISGAFAVAERNGRWATSEAPPGLAALNAADGSAGVGSVSCATASACAAGGTYTDAAGDTQGWVDGPG
jgi:hypothetical protein